MYGYANVTVHGILVHLQTIYGQLNQDALTANLAALEEPRLRTLRVSEEGGDPITEATLVRIYRNKFKNSGIFPLDIRDWDNKPLADRSCANLKIHFTKANSGWRSSVLHPCVGQHHDGCAQLADNSPNMTVSFMWQTI